MSPPTWVLAVYAVASVASFVTYGFDKALSRRGGRRVRERTLHVLDGVGGFPGGFAGQQLFKHKRRKTTFMVVFWLTAIAHAAAWTAWAVYLK